MPEDQRRTGSNAGQANGVAGGAYGLAFIGAAVYYIKAASSFGAGMLGFLKAFLWPAFLLYEVLSFIGA